MPEGLKSTANLLMQGDPPRPTQEWMTGPEGKGTVILRDFPSLPMPMYSLHECPDTASPDCSLSSDLFTTQSGMCPLMKWLTSPDTQLQMGNTTACSFQFVSSKRRICRSNHRSFVISNVTYAIARQVADGYSENKRKKTNMCLLKYGKLKY